MNSEQINKAIIEITGVARNYSECLNAMAEAEEILSGGEAERYMNLLSTNFDTVHGYPNRWRLTHATARQRAEAFLRVKGMWKEAEGVK